MTATASQASHHAPTVTLERDHRRQLVQQMTLAHMTQRDIAERLGVHQTTVMRDQQVIRRYWRAKAVQHFDDLIAQELAKYDGWEQAILLRPWVVFNSEGEAVVVEIGERQIRPLDNDDIEQLMRISAARRKLLGLDMPARTEVAVTVSSEDMQSRIAELVTMYSERRSIYGEQPAIEA